MKRYLITGGAGFIGSHLVDLLLSEGIPAQQIRIVIKPGENLDNLVQAPFEIVTADIRDRKAMFKAVSGCNIVYHLAARIDFDGKTYESYKDVNVDATQHILDACVKYSVEKIIFFSSIGVYGLPAGVGTIDGWDETHPFTYSNYYGQSKWEGEERVRKAYATKGLSYAIIRPASVYGPREKGPTLALYQAIAKKRFLLIGNGENVMHYVYVTDLVKGARLAELSKIKNGEYILAGSSPTTFKDVARFVASSIQTTIPSIALPLPLAFLIAYGFELLHRALGVSVPLFPSRVRTLTTSYWYDISKAKKQIGYSPQISFKAGSQKVGEWYTNKGWL